MRIVVARDALVTALGTVARATKSNSPMPVLSGVLIRGGEDGLDLTATDLDLTIQAHVGAQVTDPASIVLPARYLLDIVRRLPGEEVEIEVKDTKAIVHSGASRFTLNGVSIRAFPDIPRVSGATVVLPADALRDLLRRTAFATATDESRPILTGVHLQGGGDTLRATATDGFRVAVANRAGASLGRAVSVVVPGRVLAEVERVLPAEGDVTVVLSERAVAFEVGPVRVIGRLLDGSYPDILSLLPQDYPHQMVVARQSLLDALARADLLSGGQDTRHRVEMHFGPGKVVVVAQDPELGVAQEEVEGGYQGEPLRIGFNARYLIEGLKVIGAETVRIGLVAPDKAALIQGVGEEDDYRYVVLPIVLQDAEAVGVAQGANES